MDITVTPPTTRTPSPQLLENVNDLLTAAATTMTMTTATLNKRSGNGDVQNAPTTLSHRIHHPRTVLRRRCRSECLQMAPAILRSAIDCKSTENPTDSRGSTKSAQLNRKNGIVQQQYGINARKLFAIMDDAVANNIHKENSKENIATDDAFDRINGTSTTDKNADKLTELTSFDKNISFNFDVNVELLKNQQYLYKLNEEIDRKYSDIISAARTESKQQPLSIVSLKKHNGNNVIHGQYEYSKRRLRTRSESETHDMNRLSTMSPQISSSLLSTAPFKCSEDDVSSK